MIFTGLRDQQNETAVVSGAAVAVLDVERGLFAVSSFVVGATCVFCAADPENFQVFYEGASVLEAENERSLLCRSPGLLFRLKVVNKDFALILEDVSPEEAAHLDQPLIQRWLAKQKDTINIPADVFASVSDNNCIAMLAADGDLYVGWHHMMHHIPNFVPNLLDANYHNQYKMPMTVYGAGEEIGVVALYRNRLHVVFIGRPNPFSCECRCFCDTPCKMARLAIADGCQLYVAGGNCIISFQLLGKNPPKQPKQLWTDPDRRGKLARGGDSAMAVGRDHVIVSFSDGTILVCPRTK